MTLKPYKDIRPEQFIYDLPDDRIALFPEETRDNAKLVVRFKDGTLQQDTFRNLPGYLEKESILFLNNSRVIPARLIFTKESGSRVEVFCLNPVEPSDYSKALSASRTCTWECMVGNMKRFHGGPLSRQIRLNDLTICLKAEKLSLSGNTAVVRFSWDEDAISFSEILEQTGLTPLPPYIKREAIASDRIRYQTVYSKFDGSVAAPTAGLHFTDHVIAQLGQMGIVCHEITLHVGAGTFQPIKSNRIEDHQMHGEVFEITQNLIRILAGMERKATCVGTTSVRTLESLYWLGVKIISDKGTVPCGLQLDQWEPYHLPRNYTRKQAFESLGEWMDKQKLKTCQASTSLMIVPGYDFKVTDTLITNFHQPRSSLLLLIGAFIGDSWRDVYQFALQRNFRFLSYGDSSLLFR